MATAIVLFKPQIPPFLASTTGTALIAGVTILRRSGRGRRVAPASRSWTRACGSSHVRASCTNRARLITASFLTKDLCIDWRLGAAHFWDLLVDGDIANNAGNWQWVAGTGNDTRPNRTFNPIRQAHRFDPDGAYVRRYVAELSGVSGAAVHEPWKLAEKTRSSLRYPAPIVDHEPRW